MVMRVLVLQMKGVSDQLTAAMEDHEAEGKEEEDESQSCGSHASNTSRGSAPDDE